MTHPKRYSSKSNCLRAAKAALGAEAIEGQDFAIDQNKNGYAFTEKAPGKPAAPKGEIAAEHVPGKANHFRLNEAGRKAVTEARAAEAPKPDKKHAPTEPAGDYVDPDFQKALDARANKKAAKEAKRAARATEKAEAKAAKGPTKAKIAEGLMRRPEGATSEELMAATGWQAHSVRGFIAGYLKKQPGVVVTSKRIEKVTTYFCDDLATVAEPASGTDSAPELA